jgi:hypothetical protein
MRTSSGELDGYKAGIIVVTIVAFFLLVAVIVLALRKQGKHSILGGWCHWCASAKWQIPSLRSSLSPAKSK